MLFHSLLGGDPFPVAVAVLDEVFQMWGMGGGMSLMP